MAVGSGRVDQSGSVALEDLSKALLDALAVAGHTSELKAVEEWNLELLGDDPSGDAVVLTEVHVASSYHSEAQLSIPAVIEEFHYLLRHRAVLLASAVGGDKEHIGLSDMEKGIAPAKWYPLSLKGEPIHEVLCVLGHR